MAQQTASVEIPQVPAGDPAGNPAAVSEPAQPPGPTFDGEPISPAVARPRQGGAAAHGHGPGGSGPGGGN